MIRDELEPVETASPNILVEQTEQLKLIFPQVFSEGKVDFKKLRTALGDVVDTQPERYSFTWAGKRNATLLLQAPSYATLAPVEGESVNFEGTQNLFIEGDNLEVLKLLYKSYSGRIKIIYVDPPYNTGNDFVYPDNYADPLETYLEISGQKDANGNLLTSNPETSGRYHSAWLSMMFPRLFLARQLLQEDGLIFVSIDDNEAANLRLLMDELYGEENFIAQIIWKKSYGGGSKAKFTVGLHEYIFCYARNKEILGSIELPPNPETRKYYTNRDDKFEIRGPFRTQPLATTSMDNRPNLRYPIVWEGKEIWPEKQWMWEQGRVQKALANNELVVIKQNGRTSVYYKQYLYDEEGKERGAKPFTVLDGPYTQEGTEEIKELFGDGKVFPFPKPSKLLKRLFNYGWHDKEAIILDFFAGSCSTAHAVLDLNLEDGGNRRFICVQLPEPTGNQEFPTIAEVGKERIRRVIAKMKREDDSKLNLSTREGPEDLGFKVFKLVPSNYKQWHSIDASDTEAYSKQLEMFADLLVDSWTPTSVLWEVAIKEGYGLNSQIEKLEEVQDNAVWRVTDPDKDQSMLVCLDDELKPSTLSALPPSKEHVFVCRNKALDDTKAANLALQCRLKKI
jgi:adenine-specific DNA-methyltransferase